MADEDKERKQQITEGIMFAVMELFDLQFGDEYEINLIARHHPCSCGCGKQAVGFCIQKAMECKNPAGLH